MRLLRPPKDWRPRNDRREAGMGELITIGKIESKIFQVRGRRVMLDEDLAMLYGVETKQLKRQVKRNIERFPDDCVPRTYTERRFSFSSMVLCKR